MKTKEELKTLKCKICGEEIIKDQKLSNKQFENKRYCSLKCKRKGHSTFMKGRLKERNSNWKGDNAQDISTFHKRLEREKGKPNICECCGNTNAKQYDWANMTGKYSDSEDYKRLCKSCHIRYDRTKLNTLKELPLSEIDKKILSLIAIKWVKKFDERWENEDFTDYGGELSKWIEHFFNLTEEDLK